jgi:prepilin-type N-terminal cleavage/methylation domain-containing protein
VGDPGRAARRSRTGFTLLEVLVAVAVLGIVYTLLAQIAAQGLRAEGESRRELRASLLADRTLFELESGAELGTVPPVGSQPEREEDGFLVNVEVEPYPLDLPERSPRARQEQAGGSRTASLLHAGPGNAAPALRRIDVRVSWSEGTSELEVRRTSFALDREAAGPLLEALAASEGARAREAERDEEPEDGTQRRPVREEREVEP